MKSISINDISFSYEDKQVYEHYSTSFPEGQTSVIMAPSGSGKTTLLYLICGLLKPNTGNITYPTKNPRFSAVFQDLRLIESVSVENNIKLVSSNITDEDIDSCLYALGIDKLRSKKVKHLSGGEKQRVTIARALLAEYDILLLDEPFTGLDDETKRKVIDYIKEKTVKKTVLLVTHDEKERDCFNNTTVSS